MIIIFIISLDCLLFILYQIFQKLLLPTKNHLPGFGKATPPPVCRAEHQSFRREKPVRVAAWMPRVGRGAGSPFCRPPTKALERRVKRHPGRLSFGYFSLAKQRKVTRLSGRVPTLKLSLAIATQQMKNF